MSSPTLPSAVHFAHVVAAHRRHEAVFLFPDTEPMARTARVGPWSRRGRGCVVGALVMGDDRARNGEGSGGANECVEVARVGRVEVCSVGVAPALRRSVSRLGKRHGAGGFSDVALDTARAESIASRSRAPHRCVASRNEGSSVISRFSFSNSESTPVTRSNNVARASMVSGCLSPFLIASVMSASSSSISPSSARYSTL
mmetsp:Transcript_62173/g.135038  ORF Transcript_62173/g.135038 Transcript_62173/m.135038 type:complete len:200 (+) Transcript_62173:176-775(+)